MIVVEQHVNCQTCPGFGHILSSIGSANSNIGQDQFTNMLSGYHIVIWGNSKAWDAGLDVDAAASISLAQCLCSSKTEEILFWMWWPKSIPLLIAERLRPEGGEC